MKRARGGCTERTSPRGLAVEPSSPLRSTCSVVMRATLVVSVRQGSFSTGAQFCFRRLSFEALQMTETHPIQDAVKSPVPPTRSGLAGRLSSPGGSWHAGAALILLALVVLLPGLESIPVVDRDEARFAQASRQMLDSGTLEGWTIPRVGEKTRLSKPPLIYWLQAGSAGLFTGFDTARDAIWMYRLPSLLTALGTILLTWRLGTRMFGGPTGLLAGALLAICPLIAFDAHMARADELMVFCTTAAMVALHACWARECRGERAPIWLTTVLWVCIGLGMLAKGPITPMVVVLTAVTLGLWTRRAGWLWRLRPISGVLTALIVFLPWVFLAVGAVGYETLRDIAYDEVVVRSSTGRESHGAPPGYHLVLLVALLWPGSLLTGLAFGRAWSRSRGRQDAAGSIAGRALQLLTGPARGRHAECFLVAWLLPAWIVFELAATKLPHYTLPLYPAVALLSARAVLAGSRAFPSLGTLGPRLGFVVWYVIGLGIIALPTTLLLLSGTIGSLSHPPPGSPFTEGMGLIDWSIIALGALFGLTCLTLGFSRIMNGRLLEGQLLSIPAAAVSLGLTFGLAVPASWPLWITPRLEHVLRQAGAFDESSSVIASVGFHEDSLMHATRGRLQRLNAGQIEAFLTTHPGAWIVLPEDQLNQVDQAADHAVHGMVTGFNYSNGKVVSLAVIGPGTDPDT